MHSFRFAYEVGHVQTTLVYPELYASARFLALRLRLASGGTTPQCTPNPVQDDWFGSSK